MTSLFTLLLLLSLITLSLSAPCSWSAHTPLPYETLAACINSVPLFSSIANETIDTVSALSGMYVYRDINKNSPAPYSIRVDIDERLESIRRKLPQYENDYNFQSDMQRIFIEMRDAHTVYAPPRCYTSFFFYLPFPLVSNAEIGAAPNTWDQVIRVDAFPKKYMEIAANYTKVYPEEAHVVSNYTGWKVLQMDGVDPVQYLVKYANDFVGYSHDEGTRFNYVLKQAWFARNLMRDLVPPKANVTFMLQHPQMANVTEEVTVKFYGKCAYDVVNTMSLITQCAYKVPSNAQTSSAHPQTLQNKLRATLDSTTRSANAYASSVWNLYQWYRHPLYKSSQSFADNLSQWSKPVKQALLSKRGSTTDSAQEASNKNLFDALLDVFPLIPEANIPSLTHRIIDESVNSPHYRKSSVFKRFMKEQREMEHLQSHRTRQVPLGASYENLYISPNNEFAVAKKIGTDIGVLQVASFMPNIQIVDTTDSVDSLIGKNPLKEYATHLQNATRVLSDNGIKKLIVDVRGNTGGVICYGWLLAYYLSPYAPRDPSPNSDQIFSDIGSDLNCPSNLINSINQGLAETRGSLPSDWFSGGPSIERGGSTSKYTKKIILGCQLAMLLTDVDYTYRPSIQYEPSDLVILTDGTCGSTCGMFVQVMNYLQLAKVVAQGGVKGEEMAIASFKGAAVMVSDNFFSSQTVSLCPVERNRIIRRFPSNSIMTWSWLEAYPWTPRVGVFELNKANTSVPTEFIREKPERRLWSWDFTSSETLYDNVAPHLGACAKWEVKKNTACKAPFERAVSGNPCIYDEALGYGTSFDTSKCVVYQCESNYYLSEDRAKCLRMPDPFDALSILTYIFTIIGIISVVVMASVCILVTALGACCTGLTTRLFVKYRPPPTQDQYVPQLDDQDIEMTGVSI